MKKGSRQAPKNIGQKKGCRVIRPFVSFGKEIWKNKVLYAMVLPILLLCFLFSYLPMPGLAVAFKDFKISDGIWGSEWNGIENFRRFFESTSFVRVTVNTLWINLNNILWSTVLAVAFAICFNEIKGARRKRVYQIFMFIPYFFSAVIVGRFVYLIFSNNYGMLNQVLEALGAQGIEWYSHPEYWVKILVGTNLWKNVGYNVIIYIAAISGIDEEMMEAACIDGANRLQKVWHILLPNLVPTIIIMTLMAIGRIFYGDFQLIYAITGGQGQLIPTTDIIESFVYRSVMATSGGMPDYGFSAAVGLYQSFVGFVLVLGSNLLVKKYDPDYALF